jgi:hypothetical protein
MQPTELATIQHCKAAFDGAHSSQRLMVSNFSAETPLANKSRFRFGNRARTKLDTEQLQPAIH